MISKCDLKVLWFQKFVAYALTCNCGGHSKIFEIASQTSMDITLKKGKEGKNKRKNGKM